MRKNIKILFCLMLGVFAGSLNTLFAQSVSVKAKMDSTQMWIGEQTALTFELIQKGNQHVKYPIFSDTVVGNLEIVEQAKFDTLKVSDDNIQVNIKYVVTSFEDSLIYVPPMPFVTENGDTSWSNSMSLRVIQPFEIDTASNSLADIKPVFKPKFDWGYFLQRIFIVLLIIALAVLLFIVIRKFVTKKPILVPEVKKEVIPAHIEAISRLDKLKEEKLWQQGRTKEYHTELTEIVRIYIERMFNINSMEMTSEEILHSAEFLKVDKSGAYSALRQILTLADLVKFAKWNPSPNDNEMSMLNAYLFVNQTKIEEVKPLSEVKANKQ